MHAFLHERMCTPRAFSLHVRLRSTSKDNIAYVCISNRKASDVIARCYLWVNRAATCNQHRQKASIVQHLQCAHKRAKSSWESHHCAWRRGMWRGNGYTRLTRSTKTTTLVYVYSGESVIRPRHGRHQSGKLGRPLPPPPRNLQRPHRKIH